MRLRCSHALAFSIHFGNVEVPKDRCTDLIGKKKGRGAPAHAKRALERQGTD